jgi:Ca2+-transporting ATPase
MIIILIVSALLSRYLGEWRSALILGIIVIFNAGIGFFQEYKADRIMQSLASLVSPYARVLRDGERKEVAVESLVPGDIVSCEQGDAIPADMRLIEVQALSTNDFALTGESNPVLKYTQQLYHESGLGDRNNTIYMGTTVARGSAK